VQRRGHAYTAMNKYERLLCKACGKWNRGATSELPAEDRRAMLRSDRGG
jgi:hypothetical protein